MYYIVIYSKQGKGRRDTTNMALLRSDIINKDFIEQVLKKKEVIIDKTE